jgi:NADPH:quinone reductase-like Zn-dependent oxidoreductase
MKAVVADKYGTPKVLQLKDVAVPVPKDNELLIRIHAIALNAADWHILGADPFLIRFMFGLRKPKVTILGADIAGTVEAIGKDVKQFETGDEVFGDLSGSGWGGYAEYVCANEDAIVPKPSNISFEEAAASGLSAITALQSLSKFTKIKPGQQVLINGASGGVGAFAVQIAKSLEAEVTAVCSTGNIEMARKLGADKVIDYTKRDFTKDNETYDVIVAVNGYHLIFDYKHALKPHGVCIMVGGSGSHMIQSMLVGPLISLTGKKKLTPLMAKPNKKDLTYIRDLLKTGKVRPVIDKTFQLSEIAGALSYLKLGHAKGKVVARVI